MFPICSFLSRCRCWPNWQDAALPGDPENEDPGAMAGVSYGLATDVDGERLRA
jgi:hypothetical protein